MTWGWTGIDLDNGLAMNMWQAIIWTHDAQIQPCI